jgi:hypothetical protein
VTKAELFRYLAERAGAKRAPAPGPRVAEAGAPAHHESARAGKKAQYAFEVSVGRPSRKSSRKAANRQKNDVQFRMKRRAAEVRAPTHGR